MKKDKLKQIYEKAWEKSARAKSIKDKIMSIVFCF